MGITLNPELDDRIAAKVRSGFYQSPTEVVQAGLDLLEARDRVVQTPSDASSPQDTRPIGEVIAAIMEEVPTEAWEQVPTDLARNYKHYLYGSPREEEKTSE